MTKQAEEVKETLVAEQGYKRDYIGRECNHQLNSLNLLKLSTIDISTSELILLLGGSPTRENACVTDRTTSQSNQRAN